MASPVYPEVLKSLDQVTCWLGVVGWCDDAG